MAGGTNLRQDIKGAMSGVGVSLSSDMLGQCLALSTSLHVTPHQLAESWEAHSLNKNVTELNDLTFDAYRNSLRKDVEGLPTTVKAEPTGAVQSRSGLGKRRTNPAASAAASTSSLITPPPSKRPSHGNKNTGTSAVDAVVPAESIPSADSPTANKSGGGGTATAVVVTPAPAAVKSNVPKYGERTRVGQTVATYNPNDLPDYDASDAATHHPPRCAVRYPEDSRNVAGPYRYMFTPLEDRATALDEHLVGLGEEVRNRFDIKAAAAAAANAGGGAGKDAKEDGEEEDEEGGQQGQEQGGIAPLEAVGVPRQEVVCCIGRVCNEAHEGKINRTSILLEGSRSHSNGARVNLDVSSLTASGSSYSLFPGQVVAVEGLNASGRKLVAQRICEGASRPPVRTKVDDLLRYHHAPPSSSEVSGAGAGGSCGQDGQPLKIMAVAGPYTTSDNLDYDPLVDVLNVVKVSRPDVAIMMGPFVDTRQPIVSSGDLALELMDGGTMNVTAEQLFVQKVAASIEALYEDDPTLTTQIVLVPSLDDAVGESVYPQPPLCDRLKKPMQLNLPNDECMEYGTLGLQHIETAGREETGAKQDRFKRVHCVSNPCTLQINEVTIGVTSTDAMLHISTDETNANLEPGSRLTRIAQHLLQQRSYYPLFPPPAAPAMATNLDLAHMNEWSMPCQPDLLIVPSKLTTLAKKVLDSTVVVNPGMLTRGTTGGTFAVMDVHPMKRETLEGASGDIEMDHGVQDRIHVDVKRI